MANRRDGNVAAAVGSSCREYDRNTPHRRLWPAGGYHILLAGMERISVDLGQFVLAGEPVAVMENGSHIGAILTTGPSQPVLYVEFRKDGIPVDPGPWWAAGEGEKVRG